MTQNLEAIPGFDAIEMKRQGAQKVMQAIAHMTIAEQVEYWRHGTEALRALQVRLRAENKHNAEVSH